MDKQNRNNDQINEKLNIIMINGVEHRRVHAKVPPHGRLYYDIRFYCNIEANDELFFDTLFALEHSNLNFLQTWNLHPRFRQGIVRYEWAAAYLMLVFKKPENDPNKYLQYWGMLLELEKMTTPEDQDKLFMPNPNKFAVILFHILTRYSDTVTRECVSKSILYWAAVLYMQFDKQFTQEYMDQLLASMKVVVDNANNDDIQYMIKHIEFVADKIPNFP